MTETFSLGSVKRLMAIRFSYMHNGDDRGFDTVAFYQKYLRGFLAWHRGDAVWIKGGLVRREAYLIFNEKLKKTVANILSDPKSGADGYAIAVLNPETIVQEALADDRECVGYLEYGDIALGDEDGLSVEVPVEKPKPKCECCRRPIENSVEECHVIFQDTKAEATVCQPCLEEFPSWWQVNIIQRKEGSLQHCGNCQHYRTERCTFFSRRDSIEPHDASCIDFHPRSGGFYR